MGWVIGFHSARNILRKSPERVKELHLKLGRATDRSLEIEALAEKHGIVVERCSRQQLENQFGKSHQGIAIRCSDAKIFDERFLISLVKKDWSGRILLNVGRCYRSQKSWCMLAFSGVRRGRCRHCATK